MSKKKLTLSQRVKDLENKFEHTKLQAQCHAMEARGANDTIGKIYQLVTRKTGEPGNWNAEIPVKNFVAEFDFALSLLRDMADACAEEFNEKGAGGNALARLTDVRNFLNKHQK